jgi:hypothetical protein
MLFGSTAATMPAHAEVAVQAAAIPIGLTGFSSFVVLLGLIGLAVGLTRLGRRSMAAKRAAAQAGKVEQSSTSAEEPARTSA